MRRWLFLLAGISVVQDSPVETSLSSSPITDSLTSFHFAIRSYGDLGSRTPSGCKDDNQCALTFLFIVITPNQPNQYFETKAVRLGGNGHLPLNLKTEWGRTFYASTNGKPAFLDILVQLRGVTFDRFHIDLDTIQPSVGGIQNMQDSSDYQGMTLKSRMSLSLSLACSGALVGPDCDLKCNRSTANTNVALCHNERLCGYYAICDWATDRPNQVENCQKCPWGIVEDSYCKDEKGGVLFPEKSGLVAAGHRIANAALSIILFLVVCLIMGLVVFFCSKERQLQEKAALLHNIDIDDRVEVCLKSYNGKFLRAWQGHDGNPIVADMADNLDWTQWWFVVKRDKNVELRPNREVVPFLSADEYGVVEIASERSKGALWTPVYNNNGTWSFVNQNGMWLSAHLPSGRVCAQPHNAACEQFSVEKRDLQKYPH